MNSGRAYTGVGVLSVEECLKKFEVHLTPPGVLELLCRGEPIEICKEAIYIEELFEIARALGRKHLITIMRCGP
jgi:hypothetical protein